MAEEGPEELEARILRDWGEQMRQPVSVEELLEENEPLRLAVARLSALRGLELHAQMVALRKAVGGVHPPTISNTAPSQQGVSEAQRQQRAKELSEGRNLRMRRRRNEEILMAALFIGAGLWGVYRSSK